MKLQAEITRLKDTLRRYANLAESLKDIANGAKQDGAEIVWLEKENKRLRAELAIEKLAMSNVIAIIGGTDDEGNPTSRINFLQRLRKLVKFEREMYPDPSDILRIRCIKHRDVPQFNTNESGKGECGACIAEDFEQRLAKGTHE